MRHHIFEEAEKYKVALLFKASAFNKQEILTNYVSSLNQQGVTSQEVIAFTLQYDDNGKAPVKFIKNYLDNLLPALDSLGVQHLYVADAAYFKVLAGQSKAETHFGYSFTCKIKGFEHMTVVLGINYQALIFNPALEAKLDKSVQTLADVVTGNYMPPGHNIIQGASYPSTLEGIAKALNELHQCPELSCDIEGFSLRFNEAGIGTIAFAWDEHHGVAFACDYYASLPGMNYDPAWPGSNIRNPKVRALLKEFFTTYKGKLTWHSASYDLKAVIYALWMKDMLDTEGLLEGLKIMADRFDDTKIIAYLATNSTAGNVLGLKSLAHEFAGNWAKDDIKDIRKIPLDELLKYNLVDCLSTWYVKNKFTPIMVEDNQETLYKELMLPSLRAIIQMELTGMPMSAERVQQVKSNLTAIQQEHLSKIVNSPLIKVLNLVIQTSEMEKANAKLKTKQHPLEKFSDVTFNPNSGPQLQRLLYEQMGLPVIDYTDTKQPATGADTIEKLIHHTDNPAYKEVLSSLIEYGKVSKILSTFIPAFEKAIKKSPDGIIWLHGSFNLGGTVSGRLSSSDPNMQNLPSGSEYGKEIKSCVVAPPGWIFAGADFSSLEDYISALTTKDPNKLKVYLDGYDGHCLRAFSYFRDQCPDIVDTVDSVNSMKKKYPQLRQDSKGPTFLLTYGGTYHGMMSNLGWAEDKAKAIEAGYHELYKVSDEYIQQRLQQAAKDGYVEVAFGLRVRTPLLKQVIFGSSRMPYEAAAEGRTAGNAMGQSYGLLNNRAAVEFMEKVKASKYRLDIKLVALIHDAIYLLIRDSAEVVEWANNELIKSMEWQELPEIQHDQVKLNAALDLYWPSWANPITLPNKATQEEIRQLCDQAKEKYGVH